MGLKKKIEKFVIVQKKIIEEKCGFQYIFTCIIIIDMFVINWNVKSRLFMAFPCGFTPDPCPVHLEIQTLTAGPHYFQPWVMFYIIACSAYMV